jgi:hypothetical protein
MTARTILTMSNGQGIDLLDPVASQIDFTVIAEHLAKEKRYNGATPGIEYSVAEHSVRCADAALRATSDGTLAAYCLLHDGHEAFLKDDTTPKKEMIAEIAHSSFGILKEHVLEAFNLAPYRFDQAIHDAAGLAWPPPSNIQKEIKRFDLIMFVTEWRDLMKDAPHPNWAPYSGILPLTEVIEPLAWAAARDVFLHRCDALLPSFRSDHQRKAKRG